LTVKSAKSNNFQPFSKPLRAKQPVDSTKQQVVFHLVGKTSILDSTKEWITLYSTQIPPTQNNNTSFHQTPWIWILQNS